MQGNCIVILDKASYIAKAEKILNGNQFQALSNKKYYQEREKELNKYLKQLLKEKVIDQKLRFQIQSTCSSLSIFYRLPKVHRGV